MECEKSTISKTNSNAFGRGRTGKSMTRGKERPDDDVKTDLLGIPSLVMPELGRLAWTMISDKVLSQEERRQAIKNLCSLVS